MQSGRPVRHDQEERARGEADDILLPAGSLLPLRWSSTSLPVLPRKKLSNSLWNRPIISWSCYVALLTPADRPARRNDDISTLLPYHAHPDRDNAVRCHDHFAIIIVYLKACVPM